MFKFRLLFIFLCFLLLAALAKAQDKPSINFNDLIIAAEENFALVRDARKLAQASDLPHSIYLPEGIFIEAKGIENNRVVYSVINDFYDIYNNGEVVFWEEVEARFNLTEARVHWTGKGTQNPLLGYNVGMSSNTESSSEYLLIPDWTADAVMLFDATTGDLLNQSFIVDPINLGSPKQARFNPNGFISVSDQIRDAVQSFDTLGNYLGIFAPAGGVNTAVLDNIRGHNYRPNGNLVVTVGSSGNQNSIAEFDAAGNYLGQFITAGAGGLNSPFDIVFRSNDVLVDGSSSNRVHRYDLNGNYLDDFVSSGLAFPQQIHLENNGNVAVAGFSLPSALYVFDSLGTLLASYNVMTGLRGCYKLPNGNYLVTNGGGVHEITTSNTLVRTMVAAASAQYIDLVDFQDIIPVELTAFSAATANGTVVLKWATATETNNSGFEVQRSTDKIDFSNIGFVNGYGTTAEPKSYSYTDNTVNSGAYYYRLKQIDYNGAFEYSKVIEVEVGAPDNFSLEQNYPNPFNPSTVISYQMPVNGNVVLKIYDVLGNEVTTLVNEFKEAGKHSIEFDASDLGSGIYFYTITAVNFTSTKKMTLIK